MDRLRRPLCRAAAFAHRLSEGRSRAEEYDEVPADVWFNGGVGTRPLAAEESILLPEWDQCLSLIWFEEALKPSSDRWRDDEDDEPLLSELDGVLAWPSRGRRK